jgi:hypothetical protein
LLGNSPITEVAGITTDTHPFTSTGLITGLGFVSTDTHDGTINLPYQDDPPPGPGANTVQFTQTVPVPTPYIIHGWPGSETAGCFYNDGSGNTSWVACSGSSGPANITVTIGTGAVGANSCLPTNSTYYTATMTGLTTGMVPVFAPSTDYSGTAGWNQSSSGQLYFNPYPTAGVLEYQVCNGTGTEIAPGGSTVWNVSAH